MKINKNAAIHAGLFLAAAMVVRIWVRPEGEPIFVPFHFVWVAVFAALWYWFLARGKRA
jgi:hypothetical protein